MRSSNLRTEIVTVGKHSMIYLFGRALTQAVGFFMIPVYTRYITPNNYGAMDLLEILAAVAMVLTSMGAAASMSRFYYAEEDQSKRNLVVSTILLGVAMIGIPVMLILLAFSGFFCNLILEDPQYHYHLKIALLTVWFSMLCEISYEFLRIIYKSKLFVAVTTTQLIIALTLNIYFVVFLRLDILGIFYSALIAQGFTGVVLSVVILKQVGLNISLSLLMRIFSFGLPLVPPRIGLFLGFVSNRFFLRWLGSPDPTVALAQVGLFSLGHKFGVIVNRFINAPFNSFWGPRRMELLLGNVPRAKETVARICTYATLGSVYFTLLLSSGIKSVIEIMATPQYGKAHIVVPFVALSYVALGLETHFLTGILYRKKTIWTTWIGVVSIVLILLWNIVFVPLYGLLGAATSNLAGLMLRCCLIYMVSQRLYPLPYELSRIATMFLVGSALYVISQFINFSSPYFTFLSREGFVALFPVVLYFVGFYRKEELDFLSEGFRKGIKVFEAFASRQVL